MGAEWIGGAWSFGLDDPDDPLGAACDEDGPRMGPVRLLRQGAGGFAPRPAAELDFVLTRAFGLSVESAAIRPRLDLIAKALNEGQLALAMIATQQLRLPPLDVEQAGRAIEAEALMKASPTDPTHPGWPAGTSGGRGGQFRPKDGADIADDLPTSADVNPMRTPGGAVRRLERQLLRRALRLGVAEMMKSKLWQRVAVKLGMTEIPIVGEIADVSAIFDLVKAAGESATFMKKLDVAMKFVKSGPKALSELQYTGRVRDFKSFAEFKKSEVEKIAGPAGEGMEWHHIVEQVNGRELPPEVLNAPENLVRIPSLLHEEINSVYGAVPKGGVSLREEMKGASLAVQRAEGLKVMRSLAMIK